MQILERKRRMCVGWRVVRAVVEVLVLLVLYT